MADDPDKLSPSLQILSDYAQALGMLTIYWAALENALSLTIEKLLGVSETTASCISTSLEKAAARATLIQRLALREDEAPSREWRETITGLCERITNELAPARNRLAHDDWIISETKIIRQNKALKIGKVQAGEMKTLLVQPPGPSHVPEIEALTEKVVSAMIYLSFLGLDYERWKREGRIPRVPEQAVRVSKGLPRQLPQQDDQGQPPPPPSSRG